MQHPLSRVVLEDVPRVEFYTGSGPMCPEDICLPAVMRALMEYVGEDSLGCGARRVRPVGCRISCSYAFFLGITGMASSLNWKPGWAGDNPAFQHICNDPEEPIRRAFSATGYSYTLTSAACDPHGCRAAAVESLSLGVPLVAFSLVGPPEPCLVTGYDDDGDTLIGWSFFQGLPDFSSALHFEPTGEFRRRGWLEIEDLTLLIVGDRAERPDLRDVCRDALRWMVEIARTPVTCGDRANGLAAYDAWAEQLSHDGEFTQDAPALQHMHEVHNGAVGTVAEARWYGSKFLIDMVSADLVHRDYVEDVYRSAALYAGEHSLMWQLWDLAGGIGNPYAWRQFADPEVRQQMLPIIRESRDKDARAVDLLAVAVESGAI